MQQSPLSYVSLKHTGSKRCPEAEETALRCSLNADTKFLAKAKNIKEYVYSSTTLHPKSFRFVHPSQVYCNFWKDLKSQNWVF